MWQVGGSRSLLALLLYSIGCYGLFRWLLVSFGNDLWQGIQPLRLQVGGLPSGALWAECSFVGLHHSVNYGFVCMRVCRRETNDMFVVVIDTTYAFLSWSVPLGVGACVDSAGRGRG